MKESWSVTAGVLTLILSLAILGAVRKHSSPTLSGAPALEVPSVVTENRGSALESVSSSPSFISFSDDAGLPREEPLSSLARAESQTPATTTVSGLKTSRRPKTSGNLQRAPAAPVSQTQHGPSLETNATGSSANSKREPLAPAASLRVEIVSAVSEGRLTVFAGQEVILSTKLDSTRLGEALHFDCPLLPGAHALRVALYRPNESLHLQKEGFAEIVSGGLNTLDIHVNRRSKFLLRKDPTLEVKWPDVHSGASEETSSLTSGMSISR
jgi:hypothetical protein